MHACAVVLGYIRAHTRRTNTYEKYVHKLILKRTPRTRLGLKLRLLAQDWDSDSDLCAQKPGRLTCISCRVCGVRKEKSSEAACGANPRAPIVAVMHVRVRNQLVQHVHAQGK
jgi:hypothetical protein